MPLSGLNVVELGIGSALCYCGKLFSDFGADVIKIDVEGIARDHRAPDLAADSALATSAGRRRREAEIERAIEVWMATRSPDAAMLAVQRTGVAASAVRSPFRLEDEPHLRARGFWQPVERPFIGRHYQPSAPFREGAEAYPVNHPAPTLGEHNEQILTGLLGLTRADLERLSASGVIAPSRCGGAPAAARSQLSDRGYPIRFARFGGHQSSVSWW